MWAPVERENEIITRVETTKATKCEPYDNHFIPKPTYFKTNDFSWFFQFVVDTYGVPTYQEANPAVVSMVTFPFLFGMMFGDMGHGSVVLLLGIVLTLFNDQLKGTLLEPAAPLRYIVLLMGFFATYCGFIYNEFFALPLNIFRSCYDIDRREMWIPTETEDGTVEGDYTYLRRSFQCTYPAGFDPIWGLANNGLMLSNNIKMKISVIIGVLHMSIGIVTKGQNSIFFRRWADLITEAITGFIILWGLFGWMDILIYAKWFKPLDIEDKTVRNEDELYSDLGQDIPNTPEYQGDWQNNHTPSILNIMINTFFGFGVVPEKEKENVQLIGDDQEQQYQIAFSLLIVVIILIPIMLLTKPLFFRSKPSDQERRYMENEIVSRSHRADYQNIDKIRQKIYQLSVIKKEESFSDSFIHQMIETIEFVLGTVSNTASYLRLWALQLAHG